MVEWMESAYKYFPKSCQTIRRWIDEILAYFDNRTTQGAVEGINQKIKLIRRKVREAAMKCKVIPETLYSKAFKG